MLDLNEKIIKERNKNVIIFLKFFHKKFNLYKLNSLYFYYLYYIYYINNNNFKLKFKIYNKKYFFKLNYIFYLLCYNKNLNYSKNMKRYLVDLIYCYSNLINFKSNYYCLNYDLHILSSINYKLILNLWYFMLYGKYIVYIITYIYNLYLNTKCYLLKYPLINIVLRFLLRSRLDKIIYMRKYKYSKLKLIEKYYIYDINFNLNKYHINFFNLYVKKNLNKLKIFNLFNLLSNKKVYMYLNFLWYKYKKINFLYFIYYLNIYNDYDNSLTCEYNKFNILGIFSFYWQLNRYGFNVNYYFYYFSLLYFKYFNINDFNFYFYNNLNFINFNNVNLFWYKINKFIVLNHVRRSFFKYIKLNRFIIRNRLRRRIIIRKWLFYSSIYNMKFYPLKNVLYNENNIEYFFNSLKKKINYLSGLDFFNFIYKYYNKYSLNFINVINRINISERNINTFNFFQNYIINLIINKLKKFYYINILNLMCCFNVLCKNIEDKFYWYKNDKDLIFYNKKLNLYHFYKLKGLSKFMELYFLNIKNYLWKFEKSLMFCMFTKYMYHMYLFFFSVFSCYIKLNMHIFNIVKLSKNNFIIKIRLINKKIYFSK